jgi:hypothetical protein
VPVVTGPVVTGEKGLALVADGLRVDVDMTCDANFRALGEIRLRGAHIGQNLDFSRATMLNPHGTALDAEDLQADRMLMPASCEAGLICLRNAKLNELDDKCEVLPDRIDVRGLSYQTLIPPLEPGKRLEWLRRAGGFEPQPYEQLATSYRRLGYDEEARQVLLAKERHRRQTLSPVGQAWGYLQDVMIGYGYRPSRAAAWFGLLLAVGVVVFWFSPPRPGPLGVHAHFNPFFYALDLLIPFADFGQRSLWDPSAGQQWFESIVAVFGWMLASTAIAGLTRTLNRS